ncbi:EpsG family protein [Propionispira arboris]|uniref:EpsG family protein n=1 Tax=Propionispira arboris TaxID=84035 RepID=A0A1H6TWD6_9FIRM|nr:EpsG family protein [Propionispira arboris]SEI84353.1 EpsG family protein [Propionispira arboris]
MSTQGWLLFLITIFVVFMGFAIKRSKIVFLIQLIWLILLVGGNTGSLDYDINALLYFGGINGWDWDQLTLLGWLYAILTGSANDWNFGFIEYNFIMSALSIGLIGYVIKKNTYNYNVVMSLLYFYPVIEMVIQKRFLPGMAVMLYATQFLGKCDLKSSIKYLACLVIAVGLHSSLIFYILFFFLSRFSDRHTKLLKKLIIILFLVELIGGQLVPMIAGELFAADKIELYFSTYAEKSSWLKFICWAVLHLYFVGLVCYIYRKSDKTELGFLTYKLNLYSLIIIPLYTIDPVFMRFYRIVLIYDYMYLSGYMTWKFSNNSSKNIIATIGLLLGTFIYFYVWYCAGIGNMTFEKMAQPVFENNILADIL